MPSLTVLAVVAPLALALLLLAGLLAYVWIRYAPIVGRIFEETPVFLPARAAPEPGGEEARFLTADGLELTGTYLRARTPGRLGVLAFCPEFLADRWSAQLYCEGLREAGFDLFAFDFRNHGGSQTDPSYKPLQWVSDREVEDLEGALAYLKSRPDRDPAGVGLFGVSRGAGAALCVAARDPAVWAVATDGAFPTRGTMLAYILRWAEIYVGVKSLWCRMPLCLFAFAGWAGRISLQRKRGRRYPDLERAVSRLAPRPWLMIHGQKDAYISPEIALGMFAHAREPKESWIVPGAKHNRCREVEPEAYRALLVGFFLRSAPRRHPEPVDRPPPRGEGEAVGVRFAPADAVAPAAVSG